MMTAFPGVVELRGARGSQLDWFPRPLSSLPWLEAGAWQLRDMLAARVARVGSISPLSFARS
jgi:hypothetical protein